MDSRGVETLNKSVVLQATVLETDRKSVLSYLEEIRFICDE